MTNRRTEPSRAMQGDAGTIRGQQLLQTKEKSPELSHWAFSKSLIHKEILAERTGLF